MQKMVELEISMGIQNELEKIPRWKRMHYLQENGEASAYKTAKDLGWSPGKTHSLIRSLEKSGAIESKARIVNGRAVKFVKLAK